VVQNVDEATRDHSYVRASILVPTAEEISLLWMTATPGSHQKGEVPAPVPYCELRRIRNFGSSGPEGPYPPWFKTCR